jgi:hypothetical protein
MCIMYLEIVMVKFYIVLYDGTDLWSREAAPRSPRPPGLFAFTHLHIYTKFWHKKSSRKGA